jgi:hypothetical protein
MECRIGVVNYDESKVEQSKINHAIIGLIDTIFAD